MTISPEAVLTVVADVIREIDADCASLINGVECGIINTDGEYCDQIEQEVRKSLTLEPAIVWQVQKRLQARGFEVDWEHSYPGFKSQECDLVIGLGSKKLLWLEVKLASKAWFECSGKIVLKNGSYNSYLQNDKRSHSFKHDFKKLTKEGTGISSGDEKAVCLIGFDRLADPMDQEIKKIVEDLASVNQIWTLAAERHWIDRRHKDFQINCWTWMLKTGERGLNSNESTKEFQDKTAIVRPATYTAVIRQDGDWWIGWVQEVSGVNSQGATRAELLDNLREALDEAIEMNRRDAKDAATTSGAFEEVELVA